VIDHPLHLRGTVRNSLRTARIGAGLGDLRSLPTPRART